MDKCKDFERNIIINNVKQKKVAVDATCGNGFDTLFLAKYFDEVYAFDIQEKAINNTKEICKDFKNIHYILDSHENINKYVTTVDCVVFNLGYLPKGDKSLTTKEESTLSAVIKGLNLLTDHGVITIMVYEGHEEGFKEAKRLKEELPKINQKEYDVVKYEFVNQINYPPYLYIIQKR